jgi:hypothetical protein
MATAADNIDESYNAGRHATPTSPVHIDLDLGAPTFIDHLELMPYQVRCMELEPAWVALPVWDWEQVEMVGEKVGGGVHALPALLPL